MCQNEYLLSKRLNVVICSKALSSLFTFLHFTTLPDYKQSLSKNLLKHIITSIFTFSNNGFKSFPSKYYSKRLNNSVEWALKTIHNYISLTIEILPKLFSTTPLMEV